MKAAASLWRRLKGYKLYAAAGIVTAAETYVTMGGRLPYSDDIPQPWRIGLAAVLIASGFVLRTLASLRGNRG